MQSKRILFIVLGVLAVAGSAYYIGVVRLGGPGAASTHLDLVPADTLIFAGGLEPLPVRKLLEHSGLNYAHWFEHEEVDQIYQALELEDAADGIKLLSEWVVFYLSELGDPVDLLGKLGLSDEFHVTFYTVGLIPVIRFQVADRSVFERTLAAIEDNARATPLIRDLEGVIYRSYPLVKGMDYPALVVAATGDEVALIVDLGDPEAMSVAIGATRPTTSMAETGEIKRLIQEYDYSAFGTFLINHEAIMSALTSDENQAGRTLATLFADERRVDEIKLLHNDTCAKELDGIAQIWPRTVAGYREVQITEDSFSSEFHSVIEIKDTELLKTLQRARGHIPRSLIDSEDTEFALALGLDVGELGRVAGELVRYMNKWNYQCLVLAPLNQLGENASSVSMTATMGAAVGRGIKGVSIGIMDLNMGGTGGALKLDKLDAVLVVSAEDPELLLENTGAIPGLGRIDVPRDGTAVDIWLPIPLTGGHLQLPLKLALSGDHLTAFVGAKAEKMARAIARDDLETNGMIFYKVDYGSYINMLADTLKVRQDRSYRPRDREVLDALRSIDAEYQGYLDITGRGIELTGDIAIRN